MPPSAVTGAMVPAAQLLAPRTAAALVRLPKMTFEGEGTVLLSL